MLRISATIRYSADKRDSTGANNKTYMCEVSQSLVINIANRWFTYYTGGIHIWW